MSHFTGRTAEGQYRSPTIYVMTYAMDLLREGRITPRQAMLLGMVDKFCSPYSRSRNPEQHRNFRVGYLADVLRVSYGNLQGMIEQLATMRPASFGATDWTGIGFG